MNYLGDYAEDSTVRIFFTTHTKEGGEVAPSNPFEDSDVAIYKNGSATQKATVNGLTMTSPFDGIIGLHLLEIDTNVDIGDVPSVQKASHPQVTFSFSRLALGFAVLAMLVLNLASCAVTAVPTSISRTFESSPECPIGAGDVVFSQYSNADHQRRKGFRHDFVGQGK